MEVLEFVGEQYAVREDQLAVVMRRSRWTVWRWWSAMVEAGLCRREVLLAGDPGWVWLTSKGARLTNQDFSPWRRNVGRLAHIGAVCDVRLYIAVRAPEARWVCERALLRGRADHKAHVPDAELVMPDGERHALEIELTPKSRGRLRELLRGLVAEHDEVVYFCAPGVEDVVREVATNEGLGNVRTRALVESIGGVESATGARDPHAGAPAKLRRGADAGA